MSIRTATLADAAAICALLVPVFEDEREYFDPTTQDDIEAGMQSGDVWFVCEDEQTGAIVGCVCADRRRIHGNFGLIGQLGLAKSVRGGTKGIDLMVRAEQHQRDQGCPGAVIGVLDFKGPALVRHYEQKMGYANTELRRQPDPEPKKFCEIIIMTKRFEWV